MAGAINIARMLPGSVMLTADTDTGVRVARNYAQSTGGRVVAMVRPIDHPLTLSRVVADCRPRALLFVESVWWPVLAACVQRAGTPILATCPIGELQAVRERFPQMTQVLTRPRNEADLRRAAAQAVADASGS